MRLASCLRLAFVPLLLFSFGAQTTFASGRQERQHVASTASRNWRSPADEVIGPQLATIMKMAKEANGKVPALQRANAAETSSSLQVVPPSFVAAPLVTLSAGASLGNPVAADFNNDGKTDYAVVRSDGTIEVLLNPGSYSNLSSVQPLAPNTFAVGKNVSVAQVLVADMNGDGNADLVGLDAANSQILVWLGNGDGTFAADADYPVAPVSGASWTNGGAIAIADFNGDGKPDVATIETSAYNYTNSTTTITELTYLNQGNGVLAPGKEVDASVYDDFPPEFGAADVITSNGQTATGLAFLMTDNGQSGTGAGGTYLYTIASNPDGSFAAPVRPPAPILSSEGYPEIVATNLVASVAGRQIIKSAHTRAHASSSSNLIGTGLPTTDLVIVAGDGAVYDVPYTAGQGNPTTAMVLVGAPSNISGFANEFPAAPGAVPLTPNGGLVVADFDGDGYLDVLTSTAATGYVFLSSGNRVFSRPPVQVTGASPGHIVAADFDNSGYPSFLWTDNQLPEVGYYQNLGAKNPASGGQFYAAPSVGGPSTNGGSSYVATAGHVRVEVTADINGDGLDDVIATDTSFGYRDGLALAPNADIVLGMNTGAGLGANEAGGFNFTTLVSGATLFSLGRDPFLEPISIKTSAGTSLLIATENPSGLFTVAIDSKGNAGSPQALTFASTAPQCAFYYADAGDVNGDGNPDIVVAYAGDYVCTGGTPGNGVVNSGVFTFLGNGDGTFQPGQYSPIGNSLYKVKLINFTGKAGMMDLVAIDPYTATSSFGPSRGTSSYNTYVVSGNGDGTFAGANASNVAPNYIVSDAIVGDFNQDGKQDLTLTTDGRYDPSTRQMVLNTAGVLQMEGNGDRTFSSPQLIDEFIYPASGRYADLNGDGTPDLIVSQYANTNFPPDGQVALANTVPMLQIFPNLGGGVFGQPVTELVAPFEYAIASEDVEYGAPVFTGTFSKSGGPDVLLSNGYDSSLFINVGVPTLQVTSSANAITQGSSVTLTAALQRGGSALTSATGAVTFTLNGSVLGTSSLSDGIATLVVTPPAGSDTINASYSGDANDNPATSSTTVAVTALAPSFTMNLSTASLSLVPGATGTATLTLSSNATFTGAISLTCSGLPAESSCTVTPGSVSLAANQSGTVVAVIATTSKNNNLQASVHRSPGATALAGFSLAGVLFCFVPSRRRRAAAWRCLVLVLMAAASVGWLSGCSGGGDTYAGTPSGTSNVVITATSGNLSVSQAITLTVTQAQ